MHYYSTHFCQLLVGLETSPIYNYAAVNNCSSIFDGLPSVFDLHKLYTPINRGSIHWLLLRVQMAEKSIEIWNSLDHNETELRVSAIGMPLSLRHTKPWHQT